MEECGSLDESSPDRVASQRRCRAEDPHRTLGSGDGDVEATHIGKETDPPSAAAARTNTAEDDDVQLLALEAVHRLDTNLRGCDT